MVTAAASTVSRTAAQTTANHDCSSGETCHHLRHVAHLQQPYECSVTASSLLPMQCRLEQNTLAGHHHHHSSSSNSSNSSNAAPIHSTHAVLTTLPQPCSVAVHHCCGIDDNYNDADFETNFDADDDYEANAGMEAMNDRDFSLMDEIMDETCYGSEFDHAEEMPLSSSDAAIRHLETASMLLPRVIGASFMSSRRRAPVNPGSRRAAIDSRQIVFSHDYDPMSSEAIPHVIGYEMYSVNYDSIDESVSGGDDDFREDEEGSVLPN